MSFSKNEKKKRSTSTLHQKHSTIERKRTKTIQKYKMDNFIPFVFHIIYTQKTTTITTTTTTSS